MAPDVKRSKSPGRGGGVNKRRRGYKKREGTMRVVVPGWDNQLFENSEVGDDTPRTRNWYVLVITIITAVDLCLDTRITTRSLFYLYK